MKSWIGRTWLRVAGWELIGEAPKEKRYVLIAAPHTSNWDLPFMLACSYIYDLPLHWMGKDSLFKPPHERHRKMDRAELTWDNAQINHYAIRSDDTFLMKNDRGAANTQGLGKYFKDSIFYQRCNRNEVEDASIHRLLPKIREELEELREDLILYHLEQAALHWFYERRDRILTPEKIAEWTAPPMDPALLDAAE